MATFNQLLAILRRLTEKYPAVSWQLLLGLLPQHHSAIIDSYKPSPWQSWAAAWTGDVTPADCWRYISGLIDLVLT
jgi:hypothetical protein